MQCSMFSETSRCPGPRPSLYYFLLLWLFLALFGKGFADWTVHVQGYGGPVDVPPDDHGCGEDYRRGANVRVASRRWTSPSDGGTV